MDKKDRLNKILVIDNSPGFTGALKSIYQVTTKLSSYFEFIFLIPRGSINSEQLEKSNFKVLQYNLLEISKNIKVIFYIPLLIYNAVKISKYIKKHRIEIIHVNDLYNMTGVFTKLLNPSIKLVYHVRLLPNSYARRFYPIWKKIIERYADDIICVSESVAANFSQDKTTIIYDALETSSNSSPSHNRQQNETFTILYLANYIPGKGHRQAIDAYKKAMPDINDAQLVFYGGTLNKHKNDRFKKSLIQYTQELGLADRIRLNGFTPIPEQAIAKADLMLNFSESESFSMTTLEALAYGTPIIATDCGGPAEIIENDVSGIIVPVNDLDAMAKAIKTLVNNKALRDSFSQKGLKKVALKFDFASQSSKLNNLYNRLLN